MCGGLYRTVCGFKKEGKLKQPWPGIDSERIRYEHRFAPFANVLAPPVVSYNQYNETSTQLETERSAPELYKMACMSFAQSKQLLEEIPDPGDEV